MFLVTFKYGFNEFGGWPKREAETISNCSIKNYEVVRDSVVLVLSIDDEKTLEVMTYKMLIMFELQPTKTEKVI